jgi:hypothetical protein
MSEIKLSCACGQVKGKTADVSAKSGTRINCCCTDCQKFATYLEKEEQVLDQYGATDIFQIPMAHLLITQGHEHLACVRLSQKGLYRWYAKCCNTPIGNTLNAKMPFVGIIHSFIDDETDLLKELGESRGYIHCESAKAPVPQALQVSFFKITLRVLRKIVSWKIKGLNQPSAFFTEHGKAIVKPLVLKQE